MSRRNRTPSAIPGLLDQARTEMGLGVRELARMSGLAPIVVCQTLRRGKCASVIERIMAVLGAEIRIGRLKASLRYDGDRGCVYAIVRDNGGRE